MPGRRVKWWIEGERERKGKSDGGRRLIDRFLIVWGFTRLFSHACVTYSSGSRPRVWDFKMRLIAYLCFFHSGVVGLLVLGSTLCTSGNLTSR